MLPLKELSDILGQEYVAAPHGVSAFILAM
jgi:hypothetical protein